MKNDCIVCAKTFDDPEMERITCSKECSKNWQEFLAKLKMIPVEDRAIKINEFFTRIQDKIAMLDSNK